ncbi:pyridoxine transporter [Leuconostoc pseudomesenteroides]|uniref:ECF transporter S component n=1 Tax=Leuconostoc pseudomesenteroides TaxID=33968 RepID=UPI0021AAAB5E|nr:ECF transporter S component [Leuconostoc pseudomesenteroides]MCT4387288.1 pyridoxine transporter [Leuconostoc pseudomesenteroides]
MKQHNSAVINIVLVALFTSITFVATSIQVPMPALIGKPFVHLGNSAVLLSVLLLGFKRGALAGGFGLALFDLFHGYVMEAPYYFFECFVVGGVATYVFSLVHYKKHGTSVKLIAVILAAVVTKLVMTTGHNFVMSLFKGMTIQPAIVATVSSLFPTVINCVMTMIVVFVVYRWLAERFEQLFVKNNFI